MTFARVAGFAGNRASKIMLRSIACCLGVTALSSSERFNAVKREDIESPFGTARCNPVAGNSLVKGRMDPMFCDLATGTLLGVTPTQLKTWRLELDYRKLLRLHGIKASMSRKGNCLDNAPWRASLGLSRPNSCTVPGFVPGARPGLRYSSTSRSSITNDGATRASATGRRHRPGEI